MEVGFHKAVKASLIKIIAADNKKKTISQLDSELNQLISKSISTQIILELIELARKINEAEKRGESTGLTPDELAFYDALAENESAREIMGEEILEQIARDLTQSIKNSISVDIVMEQTKLMCQNEI